MTPAETIARIAEIAEAFAWQAGVGGQETAGGFVSYLAKHLYAGMNKGNGPNPDRWAMLGAAATFFNLLWNAPIQRKAIENPIMLGHARRLFHIPSPSQIIQPWQFGHGETKATCLWLKGLPPLTPTNIVEGREQRVWRMGPGPDRKKERSRTFAGIAAAMADQWGPLLGAERLAA